MLKRWRGATRKVVGCGHGRSRDATLGPTRKCWKSHVTRTSRRRSVQSLTLRPPAAVSTVPARVSRRCFVLRWSRSRYQAIGGADCGVRGGATGHRARDEEIERCVHVVRRVAQGGYRKPLALGARHDGVLHAGAPGRRRKGPRGRLSQGRVPGATASRRKGRCRGHRRPARSPQTFRRTRGDAKPGTEPVRRRNDGAARVTTRGERQDPVAHGARLPREPIGGRRSCVASPAPAPSPVQTADPSLEPGLPASLGS
jgi:hypothetical protein